MNRNAIILSVVGVLIAIGLVYFFYQPSSGENENEGIIPASWEPHYKFDSRDPYGTYMFYELIKSSTFNFDRIDGNPSETLKNTDSTEVKLLVVCSNTYPDYIMLWQEINSFVVNGNNVLFILEKDPSSLKNYYKDVFHINSHLDSITSHSFKSNPTKNFPFECLDNFKGILHPWNYFSVDSKFQIESDFSNPIPGACKAISSESEYNFIVHEENELGKPVFVEFPFGKGSIFIHRTPMAFTNIALLDEKNVEHLEMVLSKINYDGIYFNAPKKLEDPNKKQKERKSPLQFILSNPALSWAYYITIGALILFVIFNLKRRQAPIPIIQTKNNSTLEFVDALSKIYFQKHNNANIVKHKYRIFTTFIRTHYHIHHQSDNAEFARMISVKSGIELSSIQTLLNTMIRNMNSNQVTDEQLIALHNQLDNFYKNCK